MANKLHKGSAGTLGRPRKNPASIKTRYLGFRMLEEEIKAIEAAAAAAGESVSEYVRKAIVSRLEERRPQIPSTRISYEISSVTILDTNSLVSEGKSPFSVTTGHPPEDS